ncbi:MAG: ribosome biogenesis GTP-binding protein YihA/YsxC [Patescibacteria group bacterium]
MIAKYHSSTVSLSDLPKDNRPHVAMVGRSNVGKSSMINHLTHRKDLARVSSKPGRTQTMNLYDIDKKFYLVDLPGYGYAKKSLEQREVFADMIQDYLERTPELKLVLLIIDASIPPTDIDGLMLEWLKYKQLPFILVLNKMDRLNASEKMRLEQSLETKYPGLTLLEHSIDSDKNRNDLWTVIEQAVK